MLESHIVHETNSWLQQFHDICLLNQCRWYYAKGLQTDEVYLFVGYESRQDGRARFTPHASFQDPTTPPDAPFRESIEFRAYVFWQADSQDKSSDHESG